MQFPALHLQNLHGKESHTTVVTKCLGKSTNLFLHSIEFVIQNFLSTHKMKNGGE